MYEHRMLYDFVRDEGWRRFVDKYGKRYLLQLESLRRLQGKHQDKYDTAVQAVLDAAYRKFQRLEVK